MKTTIAILFSIVYTLFCGFAPLGLLAAPVAEQLADRYADQPFSDAASFSSGADSEAAAGHHHFPVVHTYHKQCNSCSAGLKYLRDSKPLLPHSEAFFSDAHRESSSLLTTTIVRRPLYIAHCAFLI